MNTNSYSSGIHRSASQPLIVSKDCWMIGYRNPSSLLQCNTYLRIFSGPRQGIGFCIDPGSQFDAAVVESNLNALTGDEGPEYITVNHQDPDVTGNLPALCRANPAATVLLKGPEPDLPRRNVVDVVERFGHRFYTGAIDDSEARLVAHDAAIRGGPDRRAAGL